jgi:protein-S-isoprenylcysteine O-methyltransferase Ste14
MLTADLFYAVFGCWGLFEVAVRIRDRAQGRGGTGHDRGTRLLIGVAVRVAVVANFVAAALLPSLAIYAHARLVGLVIECVGLVVRVCSVAALGRAFRTTVEVSADQPVVSRGPYRWLRHPSYTGLLVIFIGFGVGLNNWLGFAACVVLPALSLWPRIVVEEAELTRVLGDDYREYAARTKRLVPGVW